MGEVSNNSSISGVLQIHLPTFGDGRGFFKEVARISDIEKKLQQPFKVKQFNHSSSEKNTIRGIHIAPWNKLIYVTRGEVQAVIVDCRKESSTYGKYVSYNIGENNKSSIFVPKFCGNSYLVLSESADYLYLTDEEWEPNKEKSIAWNDPEINIKWSLGGIKPVLSEKDKNNPRLSSLIAA